jgi:hypothetical protein
MVLKQSRRSRWRKGLLANAAVRLIAKGDQATAAILSNFREVCGDDHFVEWCECLERNGFTGPSLRELFWKNGGPGDMLCHILMLRAQHEMIEVLRGGGRG